MYTREIQPPRDSPIEAGKPLLGTWDKAFREVNFLDVRRPYRFPCPRWIRDSRIKEWESFYVQDNRVFLGVHIANLKQYRMVQIRVNDRENGGQFFYYKAMTSKDWTLPKSLANTIFESQVPGLFFRVSTCLDENSIKLDLQTEATKQQPAIGARIRYNVDRSQADPLVVSLGFAADRSMYAYKVQAAVQGDIVWGNSQVPLDPAHGTGFFCDYKGFFPYRMKGTLCSAMGLDDKGRRYGFHLGENKTRENFKNNENGLWVDGRLSHLPPVRITMPQGSGSDWIIQDVEGMVDLVFTPKELNNNATRSPFSGGEFNTPTGYYNGMLKNAAGEQIAVHNIWGMGEKINLRV